MIIVEQDHKNPIYQKQSINKHEVKNKWAKKNLAGLKTQFERLLHNTKNIFLNIINQENWDKNLNAIGTKIISCEKLGDFPDKKLNNYLVKLNDLEQKYLEDLKNIQKIYEGKKTKDEKREELAELRQKFVGEQKNDHEFFEEIEEKLSRLKKKIELLNPMIEEKDIEFFNRIQKNFLYRTKKLMPDCITVDGWNKSIELDEGRLKKYQTLKTAWLNSKEKGSAVKDSIKWLKFNLSIMPILESLGDTLKKQKLYFDSLRNSLDIISTHKLAEGYVVKYQNTSIEAIINEENVYKRDLSGIFNNIKDYQEKFSHFFENYKILSDLNESMNKTFPLVKKSITNISQTIESILKRKDEALDFVNKEMKEVFILQKQNSTDKLIALQKAIENQWNQFFMDLDAINHQTNTFIAFKNITEKMAWCHLLAEEIEGDLRHLRLTEKNRNNHPTKFYSKLNEFTNLCNLVLQTNKTNAGKIKIFELKNENHGKSLLDSSSEFIKDDTFNLFFKNSKNSTLTKEYNLAMLHQKTITFCDPLTTDNTDHKNDNTFGLVWTSEENKSKILNLFHEQTTTLANELKKCKENIHIAFTDILPKITKAAATEINREGEALTKAQSTSSDKEPQVTYYSEYRVAQYVQIGAEAVKNTASAWLGYSQPKESQSGEFIKVKSPFDQIKL